VVVVAGAAGVPVVPVAVVLAVPALLMVARAAVPRARPSPLRMRLPVVPLFLPVAAVFPADLVVAFPVAAAVPAVSAALPPLGRWMK